MESKKKRKGTRKKVVFFGFCFSRGGREGHKWETIWGRGAPNILLTEDALSHYRYILMYIKVYIIVLYIHQEKLEI